MVSPGGSGHADTAVDVANGRLHGRGLVPECESRGFVAPDVVRCLLPWRPAALPADRSHARLGWWPDRGQAALTDLHAWSHGADLPDRRPAFRAGPRHSRGTAVRRLRHRR